MANPKKKSGRQCMIMSAHRMVGLSEFVALEEGKKAVKLQEQRRGNDLKYIHNKNDDE